MLESMTRHSDRESAKGVFLMSSLVHALVLCEGDILELALATSVQFDTPPGECHDEAHINDRLSQRFSESLTKSTFRSFA